MKSLKFGDIIIAAAVIFISAALLLLFFLTGAKQGAKYASVSVNGEKIAMLELDKDADFDTGTGVYIAVVGGEVFITESDCPDKLCLKQGKISQHGRMIVCLPNKVVVKIISDKTDKGVDAVA